MKTINPFDAQAEIDKLKQEDQLKRKLKKDSWPDLRPFTTEIIAWAKAKGGSKYKIKRLLAGRNHAFKDISPDRIYRFVLSINDGKWPNSRDKEGGEE